MRSFRTTAGALALLLLGSCSDDAFFGESEGPPLPGKRVTILEASRSIAPDEDIASLPVTVPAAAARTDWPQSLGTATHYGGNLELSDGPTEAWRNSSAVGARDEARRPLATPVVSDGRVFVLDSVLNVRAYDAQTGVELWAVGSAAAGEHDGFGGGLAVHGGRVFVVGGHSQVLALEASTGRLFWRQQLPGPVRGAPTVDGSQLYIGTADNRLLALRTEDGVQTWSIPGSVGGAGLLGSGSPAANDDAVIAALNTGEVMAVRTANGREAWRNSLGALRRFDFGAKLSDIAGSPVLYENTVYAASAAGRAAAFSLRTGNLIWEQKFGSNQNLWVAGDWVFAVTTEAELVAIDRKRGRVRWVAPMRRFEDVEDQTGEYFYFGPVMASGKLIVVRSDGLVTLHSVDDGSPIFSWETGNDTILPPVVAAGTLFLLADNGTLTAYR